MALRSKKKISSYIHHAFNDHSKLTVMLFFDHSFHLLLFTKGHSHYMKARWSKRKKNACFVSFAAWPGNVCICVLRFSKNSFWVCVCVSNFHRLVVFLFISFFFQLLKRCDYYYDYHFYLLLCNFGSSRDSCVPFLRIRSTTSIIIIIMILIHRSAAIF